MKELFLTKIPLRKETRELWYALKVATILTSIITLIVVFYAK